MVLNIMIHDIIFFLCIAVYKRRMQRPTLWLFSWSLFTLICCSIIQEFVTTTFTICKKNVNFS